MRSWPGCNSTRFQHHPLPEPTGGGGGKGQRSNQTKERCRWNMYDWVETLCIHVRILRIISLALSGLPHTPHITYLCRYCGFSPKYEPVAVHRPSTTMLTHFMLQGLCKQLYHICICGYTPPPSKPSHCTTHN